MENNNLINLVKEMAYNGKRYDEIIEALQKNKSQESNDSFEIAKSKIDSYIVNYQLANLEKSKALNQIGIGLVLFLLGTAVTGFSYINGNSQFVLVYGAILGGIGMIIKGYKIYRKPIEELVPRKKLFRR